jgi:hypothetical protein
VCVASKASVVAAAGIVLLPFTEAVMSGLVDALMIVAVAGLVVSRRFRAHRIDTDRRWWVALVVVGVLALREPGVIDAHRHLASAPRGTARRRCGWSRSSRRTWC